MHVCLDGGAQGYDKCMTMYSLQRIATLLISRYDPVLYLYSLSVYKLRVIEEGAVEWVERWTAKAFYRAMGGLDSYTNTKLLCVPRDQRPPGLRYPTLFVCSSRSGGDYSVQMQRRFSQLDLQPAGAVILDAHFAVFVWTGRECTPVLANMAMDVGKKFCKSLHHWCVNNTFLNATKIMIINIIFLACCVI